MPKLMLNGYNNIVSDQQCALDLNAAAIVPVCIVPGPEADGSYGDFAVVDDDDAAFSWQSADTEFRQQITAQSEQCLTGISGQYLTWHIGHVGYTFYTLIKPAPEPVPVTCPVCPDPSDVTSADASTATVDPLDDITSLLSAVEEMQSVIDSVGLGPEAGDYTTNSSKIKVNG